MPAIAYTHVQTLWSLWVSVGLCGQLTNAYKCLQILTNAYKCFGVYGSLWSMWNLSSNIHKHLQTPKVFSVTDIFKCRDQKFSPVTNIFKVSDQKIFFGDQHFQEVLVSVYKLPTNSHKLLQNATNSKAFVSICKCQFSLFNGCFTQNINLYQCYDHPWVVFFIYLYQIHKNTFCGFQSELQASSWAEYGHVTQMEHSDWLLGQDGSKKRLPHVVCKNNRNNRNDRNDRYI